MSFCYVTYIVWEIVFFLHLKVYFWPVTDSICSPSLFCVYSVVSMCLSWILAPLNHCRFFPSTLFIFEFISPSELSRNEINDCIRCTCAFHQHGQECLCLDTVAGAACYSSLYFSWSEAYGVTAYTLHFRAWRHPVSRLWVQWQSEHDFRPFNLGSLTWFSASRSLTLLPAWPSCSLFVNSPSVFCNLEPSHCVSLPSLWNTLPPGFMHVTTFSLEEGVVPESLPQW